MNVFCCDATNFFCVTAVTAIFGGGTFDLILFAMPGTIARTRLSNFFGIRCSYFDSTFMACC